MGGGGGGQVRGEQGVKKSRGAMKKMRPGLAFRISASRSPPHLEHRDQVGG